jgi:hypothetical protein
LTTNFGVVERERGAVRSAPNAATVAGVTPSINAVAHRAQEASRAAEPMFSTSAGTTILPNNVVRR